MEKTDGKKQLRKYAGQLADRMGFKYDMSKVKDCNVLDLVLALRSEWENFKYL
jgi:hypothetical protein